MKSPRLTLADLLEVVERSMKAALLEVQQAKAQARSALEPPPPIKRRGISQTKATLEILTAAGGPLHISHILQALQARHIPAQRESLVSALFKQLAPRGPFCRTAPNTFGLAARDAPSREAP